MSGELKLAHRLSLLLGLLAGTYFQSWTIFGGFVAIVILLTAWDLWREEPS